MGSFISKQPNGLYCRFSTVVDCITHYNLTKDDYIEMRINAGASKEQAEDVLNNYLYPFEEVLERFADTNMTYIEFYELIEKLKIPAEEKNYEM
jgi:hypothetical protein